MRFLIVLRLRIIENLLARQLLTAEELRESHEQRAANILAERSAAVKMLTERLRKVRAKIAITAPPESLNDAIKAWRLM